ncbi:hypothetical protein MOBT1_002419 [Malassezia obtusa]|uniref:Uncharacterized protein n=1 Tax=Malassezia obtusa TaxID=76774 RepID=A0AAF0ISJ2_9BASI|nr:hypothetical protein MOBT1_002419 [Malassezia obtusa]
MAGYQPMGGMVGAQQLSTAQLTQQLNALHLQNQQNEQIMMQQNKLLAQIQAAQELRAQADREASNGMHQQHQQSNPLLQFAQSHHIPSDLPSNRRHAISPRPKGTPDQGPSRARSPNPVMGPQSPSERYGTASPSVNVTPGPQLPPDLSKAMSVMNALRHSSNDAHYEAPDTSFNRSPRPSSYVDRDRRRESGNWAHGTRGDPRRTSAIQRNEKLYGYDTPERNAPSTPSIIIDRSGMEGASIPPLAPSLPVDVNSVGMRIGQRIVPGVNDAPPARYPDTHLSDTLPSTPNNRQDKRHSYSELGAGKPGQSRSAEAMSSRPMSTPASAPAPLIQPRRQPRGPPMESFFANNFLARRSLRTRREAMSKLCASPRAASFSGPKSNGAQAASSPLARQA